MLQRGHRTVEIVCRRGPTNILGEIASMLAEEFSKADVSTRLTANPTGADLVLLVGQGPEFGATDRMRNRVGQQATLAFWEIDPLPPPNLPRFASARQLRAAEVREHLVSTWLGTIASQLPRRIRWLARRSIAGGGALGPARHSTKRQGTEATAFQRLLWIREAVAAGHLQHVLCTNQVGVDVLAEHGVNATRMPVGYQAQMGGDEHRERDIDVVFLGHVATIPARAARLRELEFELVRRGIGLTIATAVRGSERAELLNRAKVALDLPTNSWHPALTRFVLAAACGALVVSETPELGAYPSTDPFEAGHHFVDAPPDGVTSAIEHYCKNASDRRAIVESTTALVTTQVTMRSTANYILGLPPLASAAAAALGRGSPRPQ